MQTDQLFTLLRESIEERGMPLAELARRTQIPYNRIYNFQVNAKPLRMEDAEALHVFLTGKNFIQLPDVTDQSL
jgi:hypothetical protein